MTIDFNADLGEGYGNEAALMPFLDSCSIACGGHFGNAKSIEAALDLAWTHEVKVGAHPSYPDPLHFGRQSMSIPLKAFQAAIEKQLDLFFNSLEKKSMQCHHIKAHGALYSDLLSREELAGVYLDTLSNYPCSLLYTMPHKEFAGAAHAKSFKVFSEGFLDRGYTAEGYLIARASKNAQLEKTSDIIAQWENRVEKKRIPYQNSLGETAYIPTQIDTVCVHSDHPQAVERAQAIRKVISKI